MAGKSERIRLRDLRAIYLLVGECCEVGSDPYAWHLRAFEGLRKVLGVQFAFAGMSEHDLAELRYNEVLGTIGWGPMDAEGRQATAEYGDLDMQRTDPSFLRSLEMMKGDLMVRRRRELVSDRQWYRTPHFNEFYRRAGSDDAIFMVAHPSPESGVKIHHVNLFRALGDPAFSLRDRRLAYLFFREIRRLLGRKLAPFGQPAPRALSPRLREVLALLAEGRSEKQIARELAISPHTTHDYVKQLHRRFDANNRAELLAHARLLLAPLDGPAGPRNTSRPDRAGAQGAD